MGNLENYELIPHWKLKQDCGKFDDLTKFMDRLENVMIEGRNEKCSMREFKFYSTELTALNENFFRLRCKELDVYNDLVGKIKESYLNAIEYAQSESNEVEEIKKSKKGDKKSELASKLSKHHEHYDRRLAVEMFKCMERSSNRLKVLEQFKELLESKIFILNCVKEDIAKTESL